MPHHDSLIVSLAPSGSVWAGLAFLIMIGVTVYLAATMLHDGEIEIEAAHDMAYRAPSAADSDSDGNFEDPAFDYDPELVRLSDASESARAPLGYMNWHEYDMHHTRPAPFTAEWWLLLRRLTYEDTQLCRVCPGYVHHSVTRAPSGGYILTASYRATTQAVA